VTVTSQEVIQANYQTIVDTMRSSSGSDAKMIRAMLGGDKVLMDRFLAVCFSLLAKQSDLLYRATPASIVQSIKDAAALGLEPMTDDGAIIERGGIASFNPMWRGYLKRIRNSGKVVDVDVQIVYENDVFEMEMGTNPEIRHKPVLPEFKTIEDGSREEVVGRGDYRGAYAWALMPSGVKIIEWMTTADINQVRDQFGQTHSKSGKPLPWTTSWAEMARKTVLRRLAKRLPGAAVDSLLAVDQRNDQIAAEQAKQLARIDDDLSEVRNLALQAVSGGPSTPPEGPSDVPEAAPTEDVAAGPTEPFAGDHAVYVAPDGTVSDPVQDERAPDPGADPNVAAAIALSAEQEQLARIRGKKSC
jgi:recombination protein RecT